MSEVGEVLRMALLNIDEARRCVEESEDPLVDTLLWSRNIRDVVNMALALHRATILEGILRKIPETTRPSVLGTLLGVRKDLLPFTPLSDECLHKLTLAISSSINLAFTLLAAIGTNRYSVGIIRITAILSRAKTRKGMYMDKETIIALLNELQDNVTAAAMVIGSVK